jgi:hypothetical protein
MMGESAMRRTFLIRVVILLLLVFSAGGIYAALPKVNESGWQHASEAAPPGLMEQVVRENISPNAQVNSGQMKIWKIQRSGQPAPMYLIDSRVASSATTSPLCGASGCAFFGYVRQGEGYRRVFASYLDPRLPPNIPLFELVNHSSNGLPVLKINQLEGNQSQQLTLTFNGQMYEVTETQLLPQRYE